LFPVSLRGLPYPLERARRTCPALSPEHVALRRVSLGHRPSLHRVRHRGVPRLLRYYGGVRLPAVVHHRRVSLDFPMRSATCVAGDRRTSRFPCEMGRCVCRVSDRAGCHRVSPILDIALATRQVWPSAFLHGVGTPKAATARAVGHIFRGSIPGPHVPLSMLHLRPHERRRMTRGRCGSFATPLPYDSFIHDILPV
jgi:hypothetical protein